ncbi:sugar (and other) transporter family protein [Mycolicibacterium hassiacum DSM 44199]|uniref:Sugar (And other) transporter family protein n=1 Tax=Mycolicibacterium hassiacum (strain DSM 44199 / CIP 105218 / JCM 12690 / 3849) TaxID=1122247 RepID=K5BGZ7_MYCHD|nr:MFS transporter [Mycolicibacterium hassiacum]EKF24441.1 sugar (and other) transporter family protein [Mycolicibacterium hassiacum DSM 44199]MBX5489169.1 MFS transporter [Mycolicibacterium hassiacum]MDA4084984.1 MFS transporter permease [Mycolicibacterium hassiacum DSM 44199]VCT89101.1 Tetracycline resistance protein, class C [Mycolicibacterium hassiacum DSM 44199]
MSSDPEGDCRAVAEKPRLPREVWLLAGANVVVALGYGVVAPVLPQYALHFGVSLSAATFVITAFAFMRLVAAPPAGLLANRLGERRVYISGLVIVALSTGACAFAENYWQLLVFRTAGGLGSAMFTVSSLGLMIRISPEHARGRVAGLFSTGFLIGSVGGPMLGSLTAGLGLSAPFVIYGVALLVAAGVVFVSLRGSTVAAPDPEHEAGVSVRRVLRHRAYLAALFSNFAHGWASFGLRIALVPLFVVEGLGHSPGAAGMALATFAIGNVSAVIPSGYLSDRIGRRKLMIAGLGVAAVTTVLVGLTTSLPIFLAAAYVTGAATGMFVSPQQAAVADIIGNKAHGGTAVGTFQMMADVGSIVGSLVLGLIAEHAAFSWAFVVSGAMLALAALGWTAAPETRGRPAVHTPARAIGPEAGGEVP